MSRKFKVWLDSGAGELKMLSSVQQRGSVRFPEFTGERVYMRKFIPSKGLPKDLTRWQGTVDAMLEGVDAPGPVFIMIDQGEVKAGQFHRRAGVHVDGYWIPAIHAHGEPRPHHNDRPLSADDWGNGRWNGMGALPDEALILAADCYGTRFYTGEFDELNQWNGGDYGHLDLRAFGSVDAAPGAVAAGHAASMLHATLPAPFDCRRTLVRLNVPGWIPN